MFELLERILGSVGQLTEVHTVVDFYQYIKGVEYLICIAFFVGFPRFYQYISQADDRNDND